MPFADIRAYTCIHLFTHPYHIASSNASLIRIVYLFIPGDPESINQGMACAAMCSSQIWACAFSYDCLVQSTSFISNVNPDDCISESCLLDLAPLVSDTSRDAYLNMLNCLRACSQYDVTIDPLNPASLNQTLVVGQRVQFSISSSQSLIVYNVNSQTPNRNCGRHPA